jgi:hypothetical protein
MLPGERATSNSNRIPDGTRRTQLGRSPSALSAFDPIWRASGGLLAAIVSDALGGNVKCLSGSGGTSSEVAIDSRRKRPSLMLWPNGCRSSTPPMVSACGLQPRLFYLCRVRHKCPTYPNFCHARPPPSVHDTPLMSGIGQQRRFDLLPMTSGFPSEQTSSACA